MVDPDDASADVYARARGHRDRGNALFRKGRVSQALASYTRAIELLTLDDPTGASADASEANADTLAAAYGNRAACRLKLEDWRSAIADCDCVIRLGRTSGVTVKALYRRGKAHEAVGEVDNARRDFELAAELEPSNPALLEAQDNHRSVLHRLVVLSNGTPEVRNRQRKGL